MTVKAPQKTGKNGPKMAQKMPKRAQTGLKMGPKRQQNDPKMMPKRCQNDPKVTPDRPKNGPKSPQDHPKMVLFCPKMVQNGPMQPPIWSKMAQKKVQKGAESGQKWFRCHLDLHQIA